VLFEECSDVSEEFTAYIFRVEVKILGPLINESIFQYAAL
jgi:hypothetical protein